MNDNMSFIGTLDDAIEIVPTAILSIMHEQNRPLNYVFRATVQGEFILVW